MSESWLTFAMPVTIHNSMTALKTKNSVKKSQPKKPRFLISRRTTVAISSPLIGIVALGADTRGHAAGLGLGRIATAQASVGLTVG